MSDADPGEGTVPVEGQGNDAAPTADPEQTSAPEPETPAPQDPSPQETRPADAKPEGEQPPRKTRPAVVVRYGLMKQIGLFRHNLSELPLVGTAVVVRTERGVERGLVVINVVDSAEGFGQITRDDLNDFLKACGKEYPFRRDGKVLRLANHQDVVDYKHLSSSGHEEATYCVEQLADLKLPMKLVTVEHLLGGGRIIFYFNADTRVDFRELVRRLATQYHTRIEMRQVGARDEARLVGDYERCGQRCCCQQFLQYLRPVSMRMAKTQKATLDPSKISGRCGRLMCCLRYEDVGYEELRKTLPRRNTWVRTQELTGRVVDTQSLTQLAKIVLLDGSTRAIPIGDILERDMSAPAPTPVPERRPRRERGEAPKNAAVEKKDAPPAEISGEKGPDGEQPRKRRKRRRRKGKGEGAPAPEGKATADRQGEAPAQAQAGAGADGAGHSAPPAGAGAEQAQNGEGAPPKKRRRRSRRKGKKPSGQHGSPPPGRTVDPG